MKLQNGFGSIHKIGGKEKRRNPWRARVIKGYKPDGKPEFYNVGYFPTKTAAYHALMEFHDNPYALKTMTFKDVFEKLVKTEFKNSLSEGTLKNYQSAFNTHLNILLDMKIDQIDIELIEEILYMKTSGVRKRLVAILKKCFLYSLKKKYIKSNPMELLDLKVIPIAESNEQETRIFTEDEIRELWKRTDEQYVKEVLVYLYTGIRKEELTTIQRMNNYIIVDGTKNENAKNRIVPIHPDIADIIKEINVNVNTKNIYLFLKKEFNHKLHDTRHTFITFMRRSKVNDLKLKTIVGHSKDSDVTDGYDHSSTEDLDKEILLLNYPKC